MAKALTACHMEPNMRLVVEQDGEDTTFVPHFTENRLPKDVEVVPVEGCRVEFQAGPNMGAIATVRLDGFKFDNLFIPFVDLIDGEVLVVLPG
jgi:hypothetical protein